MNKKEKDKVEFLKQFVRENYYLFCENKIFDFGYKTQQAKDLYLRRRKATAFLRFAGVKDLNGIVLEKKNFKLIRNATLWAMCNFFSQTIIPVPDKELNQKQKYSSDFIKIFKYFLDAFTLKQIPEKEWSYIIEHVFPALRYLRTKEFLISDFSEKDLIETKMNGYHFRPHGWIPENSTLKAPLVGLEIEFYHQNRSIYNKFSNFFYFQHDGSLLDERGGTELTTRPLPIESLLKKNGAIDLLCEEFFPLFGSYSQSTKETGLHVHVSRIKCERSVELLLKKCFYSLSYELINEIFGRDSNQYCFTIPGVCELKQYGVHPISASPKGQKHLFDKISNNRYCELNFSNNATIEFRRGKGTVKKERIKTIVDFCYFTYLFAMENREISLLELKEIAPKYISFLREKCMTKELYKLLENI